MGRKNANTPDVKKETFVDKVSTHSGRITTVAGAAAVVYPISNGIFNMIYQSDCERFYHIPGKYFHATIDYRLLYLGCIILIILMCAFPVFMKKYSEENGKSMKGMFVYSLFLSVILGMEIGLFNVYNLVEILKATYDINQFFTFINDWLNNHVTVAIIVVIVMGSFSLVGIVVFNEIRNAKARWFKNIIILVFTISLGISILLMLYGTMFKLNISIEDIIKYETVTNQENSYIVLSESEDKFLVVKYQQEDGKCILLTDEYSFLDKYEGIYNYISLKQSPEVKNVD